MRRLMRSIGWAVALVLLLTHSPWADEPSGNGGPPPPPWADETVERPPKDKPPEVKNKDDKKEYPFAWCPRKLKDGTTEYQAFYDDGTEVRWIPGVRWIVKIPDPEGLQGPTKVIYDLQKGTKTVEEPGKAPVTTPLKGFPPPTGAPPPGAKAPATTSTIAPVPGVPTTPTPKTTKTTPGSPTTVERPPTSGTQETPPTVTITFIIKAGATVGGPGDDATVHFEDPPPITPEVFVAGDQTKTAALGFPWDGGDTKGPTYNPLVTPPPDGQPPDGQPPYRTSSIAVLFGSGTYINIGWGWAHATVPAEMVFACADMDEYQEYMDEYRRLWKLAKQAEEGGQNHWRNKAASVRSEATRVENKLASRSNPQETAANARRQADKLDEIAKELEERGVPDRPDPKLPKAERDALEKTRTDAIEKIYEEARQQLRQAGKALK